MSLLNQMEIFYHVATENSFSKAAIKLGLSKGYVSLQMSILETSLGAKLIHRTTRRLNLTEAGYAFYDSCSKIIQEKNTAQSVIESFKEEPSGQLRITAVPSLTAHLLPGFLTQFPNIDVLLEATPRVLDLIEEEIDIAIRFTFEPDERLIAKKIGEVAFILCASPEYLATHGTPKVPEDLSQFKCLEYALVPKYDLKWRFMYKNVEKTINLKGHLVSNNDSIIYEALIAGKGLAFLPDYIVRSAVMQKMLVPVLKEYQMPNIPIYAVYPSLKYKSPKISVFIQYLAEILKTL